MNNKFLSIIIPCYNEDKKLIKCYSELTRFLDQKRFIYEIVFINDGSTDKTEKLIKAFEDGDVWVKAVTYKTNKGKGYAVYRGLIESKYKTKLILDCDLSIHIKELKKYNWYWLKKQDIIKGHRIQIIKQPFYRVMVGKIWKVITYLFTGLYMDTQSPFTILNLHHSFYKSLRVNGFAFDVEILYNAKKQNKNIQRVMVNYRNDCDSKVTFKKTMLMLKELYQIRCQKKHLK